MQELLRDPPDRRPVNHTQNDRVTPRLPEPQSHRHPRTAALGNAPIAHVLDQVQRQEQERVAEPIVGTGLGDDDLLQIFGDVVIRELALDDDVRQDWVCGRDARADGEGVQKGQVGDEGPDQKGGGEPHGGHDGAQEDGEGLPLLLEVAAGELDTGEDQLHAEDEAGEVENDRVEILLGATTLSVSLGILSPGKGSRWAGLRIVQGSDEVGRVGRKGYSSQERYHW